MVIMKVRKKLIIYSLLSILIILSLSYFPVFANNILIDNATINNDEFKSIVPDNNTTLYSANSDTDYSYIEGKEYYIKNMYTGQYMDVSGGNAGNGVNVQQYKFNGTDAQRWYIRNNGDGTFCIFTRVGADNYYRYALDLSNALPDNDTNIHIWEINGTDAQKFKIFVGPNYTFLLKTKPTNFEKAVVLRGPAFNQGQNIEQYTFQNHANEIWIFEPVEKNTTMGYEYSKANYNKYVPSYPNLNNMGGDCANFVSQCMLASGIHYQNDWYIYRSNFGNDSPSNSSELNSSWEVSDPSPWISAKQFSTYWKGQVKYHYYKGSEIVENPSLAWNLNIAKGDVVQIANNTLGFLGAAQHTMYISGYSNSTYLLTYHSSETQDRNLLDICNQYPNEYFVFYEII